MSEPRNTRGILNPNAGFRHFTLARFEACEKLTPFVDWYWVVRWDLPPAAPPFEQVVLPHPCVNLAVEERGSAVHGVCTRRTVVKLSGRGRVVAAKFVPGGFQPFSALAMSELRAKIVPLRTVFGGESTGLVKRVLACTDDRRAALQIEAFLLRRLPMAADPARELATRLVARITSDHALRRTEDLARVAGVSVRSLSRLFREYIGVGPKWVIQRARVQEAAERVISGRPVAWPRLAQDLGYHDQAHFIRDFKSQIGFTPTQYAKRCAEAARPSQP